jgi:protein-S-isoprenylcysteine O-methyltransferase Ste14
VRTIISVVVGGVGIALTLATNMLFRRTGQNPLPWMPSRSMIVRGPYRFSRNPMYLGAILIQAAVGLAVNNMWMILLCIPALIVIHFTAVLPEERYLSERFGQAYERYQSKVRRYF